MDKTAGSSTFVVEKGDTWYSIGNKLYDGKFVRSYKFYKLYIKLFRPKNVEAGSYIISASMTLPEIVDTLEAGTKTNPNNIKITFKEGLNMRGIAKVIDENTDNSYDDVMNLLADTEYIDSLINEYWFLAEEIKNSELYYPLEGYLFPNTYEVDKTGDVKSIFKVMLDQMDKELSKYKEDITKSKYSIHEILTLASIIELEAGNISDRSSVAGVFYNRLENRWTLGSDVTTYYALKIDDPTYVLNASELATCSRYNTRGNCVVGLPVGPIDNPGAESIKAAMEPAETDMFYFVADCDGKTYLAKTEYQHNRNIANLKKEGKWSCFTN